MMNTIEYVLEDLRVRHNGKGDGAGMTISSTARKARKRENRLRRAETWQNIKAQREQNCQTVDNVSPGIATGIISGDWKAVASIYVVDSFVKSFINNEKWKNENDG